MVGPRLALTCAHVLGDAAQVTVLTEEGAIEAERVDVDEGLDVALLQPCNDKEVFPSGSVLVPRLLWRAAAAG